MKIHIPSYNQAIEDIVKETKNEDLYLFTKREEDTKSVSIDVPDEELLEWFLLAHENDMTLNELVRYALEQYIIKENTKDVLRDIETEPGLQN